MCSILLTGAASYVEHNVGGISRILLVDLEAKVIAEQVMKERNHIPLIGKPIMVATSYSVGSSCQKGQIRH